MLGYSSAKRESGKSCEVYNWVIACACSVVYLVTVGTNRADGVIFKSLLEYNPGVSREELSWPFTLFSVSVLYGGSLAGLLTTCVSYRAIIFSGAILCSLGSVLCFFFNSTAYLSTFYGIIRGTGMALATIIIPGLITNIFGEHRATAIGVATIGAPVAGFILPSVVQLCLSVYGLRGTFLLIGGISLQGVVAAMLLVDRKSPCIRLDDTKRTTEKHLPSLSPLEVKHDKKEALPISKGNEFAHQNSLILEAEIEADLYDEYSPLVKSSKPAMVFGSTEIDTSCLQQTISIQRRAIPVTLNSLEPKPKIMGRLKSIFTCKGFYLATLTEICLGVLLGNYDLIIIDYAEDKGVNLNKATYLLTVNALGEIVGKLTLGWVTDKMYMSNPGFLALTMMLTGFLLLLLSFVEGFWALMTIAVLVGICYGAAYTSAIVVFSEYIDKENVCMAISFSKSIVGVTSISRSPLIGFFRDHLGSYDHLVHFMSALCFISSLIWWLERFYRNNSESTNRK